MTEVVTAIRRVTDIMGEISAASSEQSAGVDQIGEAVTQMDQATQQNAALVEEMAAAAASLNTQAGELVNAVAVFKLAQDSAYSAGTRFGATAGPAASAPSSRPCWVPPKPPVRCAPQQRRPPSQPPAWLHRVGRPTRPPPQQQPPHRARAGRMTSGKAFKPTG